jgi:hypothetical protein
MKKYTMIVILLVAIQAMAGGVKESKKYTVTNAWQWCVDKSERGAIQLGPDGYELYNMTGLSWITGGSITNGMISTMEWKCNRDHISDYPKKSERIQGIQWVREYEQAADIGGSIVTSRWTKYDYPHEKITTTTVKECKIITTVTTNRTEIKVGVK